MRSCVCSCLLLHRLVTRSNTLNIQLFEKDTPLIFSFTCSTFPSSKAKIDYILEFKNNFVGLPQLWCNYRTEFLLSIGSTSEHFIILIKRRNRCFVFSFADPCRGITGMGSQWGLFSAINFMYIYNLLNFPVTSHTTFPQISRKVWSSCPHRYGPDSSIYMPWEVKNLFEFHIFGIGLIWARLQLSCLHTSSEASIRYKQRWHEGEENMY